MEKILHQLKEKRKIVDLVVICIVTFLLSIPNLSENLNLYFDDGCQHLMRAYGAYQTILRGENGNIISDFANGFGYSWDLFYGPLSEYLLLILGVVAKSFNAGFKILTYLLLFLAGRFMYQCVHEMTDNRNTALLAAIVYITSPYFFTDIYIRHSLGEAMAFVFVPMVFSGLYRLLNTEKNHYDLVFGAVGLILSHNISTVLTAIFALIYCLVNVKNLSRTHVKKGLLIDIAFILLLTSFYWGPFLQTKFFTDYRVFDKDAMASEESVLGQALSFKDLFITSSHDTYVFEIGLPVILMLAFSLMAIKNVQENKKEYIFFLVSGLVCVWMSTKYFPWKILPNSCYIIQFPWRMLLFSSFFFAIVTSINMTILIRKFNGRDVFVIGMICMIYVFSRYSYIPYEEYVTNVKDCGIMEVSGQKNEWLPGMGRLEYLPSKAHENSFYIATREKGIVVLEGTCHVQEETKVGNYLKAKIKTEDEKVTLELPYFYYPGYAVKLDGILLKTFETQKGFVGISLEENEHGVLEVRYTATKIMHITKIVSLISCMIFAIYVYQKR